MPHICMQNKLVMLAILSVSDPVCRTIMKKLKHLHSQGVDMFYAHVKTTREVEVGIVPDGGWTYPEGVCYHLNKNVVVSMRLTEHRSDNIEAFHKLFR